MNLMEGKDNLAPKNIMKSIFKTDKIKCVTFKVYNSILSLMLFTSLSSQNGIKVKTFENGRQTYILPSGDRLFQRDWTYVTEFNEGYSTAFDDSNHYAIDAKGKILFTLPESSTYSNLNYSGEGRFSFSSNFRVGFYDTKGRLVIPSIYADAGAESPKFSEGVCCVLGSTNSYYIFIDKNGKKALDFKIEGFMGGAGAILFPEFHEGLCIAHVNYKFGYIDHGGKWVIPPKFDRADRFSEGLAAVRILGKVFFINKKGEQAIARSFGAMDEGAAGFRYGFVQNGEATVNIDISQIHIDPADYSGASPRDYSKDKFAIINMDGQVLRILQDR